MLKRTNIVLVLIAAILAMPGTGVAQKASVPKPQDKVALGQEEVKQLLLLMMDDADRNGEISKAEFMRFMEAEFDRLDKDKRGRLDVKALVQSKLRASRFTSVGK